MTPSWWSVPLRTAETGRRSWDGPRPTPVVTSLTTSYWQPLTLPLRHSWRLQHPLIYTALRSFVLLTFLNHQHLYWPVQLLTSQVTRTSGRHRRSPSVCKNLHYVLLLMTVLMRFCIDIKSFREDSVSNGYWWVWILKRCSQQTNWNELNWTDPHPVDPVTRRVIGHARQRHEVDWLQFANCSSFQFSSVQFVRCEHGLTDWVLSILLQITETVWWYNNKTLLSIQLVNIPGGPQNVPNSNDHDSKTKAWLSVALGDFILICLRLLTTSLDRRSW